MKKIDYSQDYDAFCRMFREERERLGLSQAELGELLDMYQPFVARIEMGDRRLDVVEFVHIMRKMGVKPLAFFTRLEKQIKRQEAKKKKRAK